MMFVGTVMTGGWLSRTQTVNIQVAVLPATSRAMHVTGVMPVGKAVPEAGVQVAVTPG